MNSKERTLKFLENKSVDRPPVHPIIMRWAAKYAEVPYGEFCLNPESKCRAMIQCARDFDLDWVTVMSDPYCEAESYGIEVEYPKNDLPLDRGGHFPSPKAVAELSEIDLAHYRPSNRIKEISIFNKEVGDEYFILGWVEGPVAEYADVRGLSHAAFDLMDEPEAVHEALDTLTRNAIQLAAAQIQAGAHCIGIGDAFCSQIGPSLYKEYVAHREKQIVDHIHSLGAKAKLHICGNTHSLLPDMISTGADIIDVDHLVPSVAEFTGLLSTHQVFSGKADPVSIVEKGSLLDISTSIETMDRDSQGRCIISAGCEITPDTTIENFKALTAK